MPSLWTDDDHSAHPWVAARSHDAPPAPSRAPHDEQHANRPLARYAMFAAVGVAAAVAGALAQVLL